MKLNRKWILVIALVVSMATAISGTLAYLTDRDSEANVFVMGNVQIDLNEAFDQGAVIAPGVDVEKKPTITNTGKNDAWVWATIAIPAALDDAENASDNVLHFNYSKDAVGEGLWTWQDSNGWMVSKADYEGVEYNVYAVLYQTSLEPGQTTPAVMTKVYMDPHIDVDPDGNLYHVEAGVVTKKDWNLEEDGNPIMYVSAYAMQTEGFNSVFDAYAAYNKQWTTSDGINNGIEWGTPSESTAESEGINQALAAGVSVTLSENVSGNINVPANGGAELNLNNKTLNGGVVNSGTTSISNGTISNDAAGIQNTGDMTIENVKVEAGNTNDYALILTGNSNTVLTDVDTESSGGGIGAVDGAKVEFNSGTVYVDTDSTSGRYVFYAEGEGTEITINGGEFSWDKNDNPKRAYIYAGSGTTVYVNGGTFGKASTRSGYTDGILGDGRVIITGGTFGFDPTKWVAEGYSAVKNNSTWTVVSGQ